MSDSPRFEFQTRMLEKGIEEIQRQISRLDEVLFKIKAAAITVWIGLIGWAFTTRNDYIIPLGIVVVIGFWLLEGLFRGIQVGYIDRSIELTRFLNDREALDNSFQSFEFPPNLVYPVSFRESEARKLKMYGQGLISPSVATLYLFLAFINLLIWIANRK